MEKSIRILHLTDIHFNKDFETIKDIVLNTLIALNKEKKIDMICISGDLINKGGIDYSKLGFKHKTMMGMLYKKASTLSEDRKTAEVKAMIETYNKQVDFVDLSSLEAIIEACQEW